MAKKFDNAEERKAYFRERQALRRAKLAGFDKPEEATEREWLYACERALRAKSYAEKFPEFVKPSEVVYQEPLWQWENEVRGRTHHGSER